MTPTTSFLRELGADLVVSDSRLAYVGSVLADLREGDGPTAPDHARSLARSLEQLAFAADDPDERRSLAEAAYICRRAQDEEALDGQFERIRHLLFLSVDGLVAGRQAEVSLLLREHDVDVDGTADLEGDWSRELAYRLGRAFVLLCRKGDGWDDVRAAVDEIGHLRELQEQQERSWFDRVGASTEAISDVVALYNLARIVDVAGHYVIEGAPADPHILIERHASQAAALAERAPVSHEVRLLIPAVRHGALELVSSSIWYSTRRLGQRIRDFVDELAADNRDAPILDLWPSQRQALAGSLLDPAKRAIVVEMPTSAGKTLVAEFAIVQSLALNPDAKVVYVVPTRALVNQITARLRGDMTPLGYQVEAAVPVFELDPAEDEFLQQDFGILVLTPEKLDLLVRVDHPSVEDISLVVADEAHNISDGSRGARLELLLGMIRRERAQARFLLLTPFVPNGEEIAAWLGDDPDGRIQVNWRPSERIAGAIKWDKIRNGPYVQKILSLPSAANVDLEDEVEFTLGTVPAALGDAGRSKGRISAAIAADLASVGGVLVLARGRKTSEDRAGDIAELMPQQALSGLERAVAHFARAELGTDHPLPTLISRGVAFHHAGLSHDLRQLVELLIERGAVKVVCGTTTLAQGVNFPIASVIVESQSKYVGPPEQWADLSYAEFWNIAGRAGRALKDALGLVLFPCRNPTDVDEARTFLQGEAEAVSSVLLDAIARLGDAQEEFNLSFVARNPAVSVFLQYLTHALRIAGREAIGGQIEDILRSSFVYAQARSANREVADRLVRIARQYIEAEGGRNRGYLALADGTGFSLSSIDFIMAAQREASSNFEDPAFWDPQSLFAPDTTQLTEVVDVLGRVPEIELGETGFGTFNPARVAGMVRDWVNGNSIQEIANRWFAHIDDSRDRMMRASTYVNSQLVGLVPWGMGVVQRMSLPESATAAVGHIPSLVFYGVSTKEAVGLRMGGVPRVAAEGLADKWRQAPATPRSFADVRNWVGNLTTNDWASALPEDTELSGSECRRVWTALAGLHEADEASTPA